MPSGDILDARGAHDPLTWLDDWAPFVDAYGEDLQGYDPESVEVSSAEIYGWRGSWPHLVLDSLPVRHAPWTGNEGQTVAPVVANS